MIQDFAHNNCVAAGEDGEQKSNGLWLGSSSAKQLSQEAKIFGISLGCHQEQRFEMTQSEINEAILFQRLIVLMECTDDLSPFYEYELTPTPTSFFKDGYLRKANKSNLASALIKNSTMLSKASTKTTYEVDGGAPLHRVCNNNLLIV